VTVGSSRLRMHKNQYDLKMGASRKMEAFKGTLIVISFGKEQVIY
jgi:hypothetical protein